MNATTLNQLPAVTHFAQPIAPVPSLPAGPVLWLPSGRVDVQDSGRLFAFVQQWIVAVGLSDIVFLVVRERTERYLSSRLLHELMGYLVACGADVIPLDFRCPLSWRQGSGFPAVRSLWAAEFFATSQHLMFQIPMPLSDDPRLYLSLESLAMDGAMYWQDVHAVATAVLADPQLPVGSLRAQLMHIARKWEPRWNETLARASQCEFERDPRGWVMRCDVYFRNVVRTHLEPHGYRMSPATIARIL